MRKKDINTKIDDDFIVVKIHTKKRKRGIEIRKVPIRKNDELASYILFYIEDMHEECVLFQFSRQTALNRIKKYDKTLWCHLFRHARLTELAEKMTDQELTQFAGWTDSRPSKNYIHLKWRNLKDKV